MSSGGRSAHEVTVFDCVSGPRVDVVKHLVGDIQDFGQVLEAAAGVDAVIHLAGEPVLLPTGERSIRFFPEFGVDLPLWESFTDNYPVERSALPLPLELEDALAAWNARWDDLVGSNNLSTASDHGWEGWRIDGLELLSRLRTALAGTAEVRPEFLFDGNVENYAGS